MRSLGVLGLAFVICLQWSLVSSTVTCDGDCKGKLIFTHVIWRHGDRAPAVFFPTDPNSNPTSWTFNLNQLTPLGMQQQYRFGRWLRERYGDVLLSEVYSENEICVQSTDVDRTIASAYANLAGLYPPIGNEVWNTKLAWQPIPVHTVPVKQDYLLAAFLPPCPVYDQEYNKITTSAAVQKLYTDNKPNIDYVLSHAGYSTNDTILNMLGNVLQVGDTLTIESIYKKPLPAWTKTVFPGKWIDDITVRLQTLSTATDLATKFRVGLLLREVLNRSKSKAAGTLVPNYSAYFYSAHDINIATILSGLGVYDNKPIQYAAALLFEIRVRNNVAYLELYYKRSADDLEPELIYLPTCGYSCSLNKMSDIYSYLLSVQTVEKLCTLPKTTKT